MINPMTVGFVLLEFDATLGGVVWDLKICAVSEKQNVSRVVPRFMDGYLKH